MSPYSLCSRMKNRSFILKNEKRRKMKMKEREQEKEDG
jgi:hypothetical protein